MKCIGLGLGFISWQRFRLQRRLKSIEEKLMFRREEEEEEGIASKLTFCFISNIKLRNLKS